MKIPKKERKILWNVTKVSVFKQKLRRTAYISLDRENLRIKGFSDKGEKRGGIKGGKGGVFPKQIGSCESSFLLLGMIYL